MDAFYNTMHEAKNHLLGALFAKKVIFCQVLCQELQQDFSAAARWLYVVNP